MNGNLIEYFLNMEQVSITDFSLIRNVDCDNIVETFNCIFKSNWTYEILKVEELNNVYGIYIVIAVYVPGRAITSIASGREGLNIIVNKALVKALVDCSSNNYVEKNKEISVAATEGNKETVPETNLEELENSIKNNSAPKNEYGIRQDQISFMNDFKTKYTIDTDEKFNHYIQTWSDNSIYEINTKKELILAGEKVVDEFIKWISLISNDASPDSIVSPI